MTGWKEPRATAISRRDGSVRRVANSSAWSVSVVTPPQVGRLMKAIEQCWPASDCQRCCVHRARNLYAKHGFVEIDRYNEAEYADHWFEKRLTSFDSPAMH